MGLRTWLGLKRFQTVVPPPAQPEWRDAPWLTDGAVDFLEAFLNTMPQARVLEFGIGASTLWLAKRGVSLRSFEHDPAWHAAVCGKLIGFPVVDVRLHERPYYSAVAVLPSRSIDLVLVDGRDRVECVRHAMRLVKPGGSMLVDNTERITQGRYADIPHILAAWTRQDFEQHGPDRTGWQFVHPEGRWITSVWQRPSD